MAIVAAIKVAVAVKGDNRYSNRCMLTVSNMYINKNIAPFDEEFIHLFPQHTTKCTHTGAAPKEID